ncbi:MAG: zinc-dependent alcohol dehydrogenase family protein [Elusimicrobia bacterium]|nr:zinc-dependent alcohol dehydrogenase family protein [Elusimicrobiota bacterium]
MRALVFLGAGKFRWEERPLPAIEEQTDAVVRITATTICGTDLHILKGDVPTVEPGRVLGHEGVGVVVRTGASVRTLKTGDRVLVSCISSCALCAFCRRGMPSQCEARGGWVLGHRIDGTQADYVRIPYADSSLHRVPEGASDSELALLSDIFPTAYECGVLNGGVKPGDAVLIVGAGPIGLAAVVTAQLLSPARIIVVDTDGARLSAALSLGATDAIVATAGDAARRIHALTRGRGVDVAIEAVGVPETFGLCQDAVAAGGSIANVGVHGRPVELKLDKLWSRNIRLTTRLVDTVSIPMLLEAAAAGRLAPGRLVTHRYRLDQIAEAYRVFERAASHKAIKVLLTAGERDH